MRLMAIPGVMGTAVGRTADGRPAIKIFTKNVGVGGLPDNLEGIPVEVEVTGQFFANACTPSTCTNTDVWPAPVPIGVSTGNVGQCSAGTIGARVRGGGAVYALSNNHVYALENAAPLGSNVLQPGLVDTSCDPTGSNVIGTLSAFAPISFCNPDCANNTIDAAIALSDVTRLDNKTPPAGYGTPLSAWWPDSLGLGVKKYGRTTSLTTGQVTGIDATMDISYGTRTARFIHQTLIGNCPNSVCSGSGDSGSLWVTNDASAEPVGLHFAGNGSVAIANPIDTVLTYFAVSVDGNPAPTATGGLTAPFPAFGCNLAAIRSITASGTNAITLRDGCGDTGTLTLSGATASGGLTAPFPAFGCNLAAITSITASGTNAIALRDGCGDTGTLTLSGATAIGGLTAPNPAFGCNLGAITAVTGSVGSNAITVKDGCRNTGYLKLSF
jgi:hypothetical protein